MKKGSADRKAAEVYRLSGNPYARMDGEDDKASDAEQLPIPFHSTSASVAAPNAGKQVAAPRNIRSGNPYAILGYMDEAEWDQPNRKTSLVLAENETPRTLSKKDFSDEARRIFFQYVPDAEGRRLRPQYIDFIQRNCNRSPEERHQILERLKHYDLRAEGISGHFNREDTEISAKKLAEIENLD